MSANSATGQLYLDRGDHIRVGSDDPELMPTPGIQQRTACVHLEFRAKLIEAHRPESDETNFLTGTRIEAFDDLVALPLAHLEDEILLLAGERLYRTIFGTGVSISSSGNAVAKAKSVSARIAFRINLLLHQAGTMPAHFMPRRQKRQSPRRRFVWRRLQFHHTHDLAQNVAKLPKVLWRQVPNACHRLPAI